MSGLAAVGRSDLQPIAVRYCPGCDREFGYIREDCPHCGLPTSERAELVIGRVYSVTRVHRAPEDFAGFVPYDVALVQRGGLVVLAMAWGLRCDEEVIVGQIDHAGMTGIPFALRTQND